MGDTKKIYNIQKRKSNEQPTRCCRYSSLNLPLLLPDGALPCPGHEGTPPRRHSLPCFHPSFLPSLPPSLPPGRPLTAPPPRPPPNAPRGTARRSPTRDRDRVMDTGKRGAWPWLPPPPPRRLPQCTLGAPPRKPLPRPKAAPPRPPVPTHIRRSPPAGPPGAATDLRWGRHTHTRTMCQCARRPPVPRVTLPRPRAAPPRRDPPRSPCAPSPDSGGQRSRSRGGGEEKEGG